MTIMDDLKSFVFPHSAQSLIISFTISIIIMIVFLLLSFKIKTCKNLYLFLNNIVKNVSEDSIGKEHSHEYTPMLLFLFLTISLNNLMGLVPGVEAFTSKFVSNFFFCILVFLYIIYIGFKTHGFYVWRCFIPSGVPAPVAPFIFCLELFSFILRPLTLSLRLFMNIALGHLIIELIEKISLHPFFLTKVLGVFLSVIVYFFETFVSVFQGYIFILMVSMYIGEFVKKDH
jgi:F-type H+-transporting ATPase subunit a